MSQWGLSGMKQRARNARTGAEELMRQTVLQSTKSPIRNWVYIPMITDSDDVADKNPLRWGWVISAT